MVLFNRCRDIEYFETSYNQDDVRLSTSKRPSTSSSEGNGNDSRDACAGVSGGSSAKRFKFRARTNSSQLSAKRALMFEENNNNNKDVASAENNNNSMQTDLQKQVIPS